jgi:hypothetical protein
VVDTGRPTVGFTFAEPTQRPTIEESKISVGFTMRGKSPDMTREQLLDAWRSFWRSNGWVVRKEG